MLLRLTANKVSAAGLTYLTSRARSKSTTAVASQSRPGETAGLMGRARFLYRCGRGVARLHAAARKRRPLVGAKLAESETGGEASLPEAAELAAKLLDVFRVLADRFLVGLQSLQHPSIVALVAIANSFLLGQLLPGVGEQLLLVL